MKKIYLILLVTIFTFFCIAVTAKRLVPWRIRFNKDVETFHITAHKNTPSSLWPKEPETPKDINSEQFKNAFSSLCNKTTPTRISKYSDLILKYSRDITIDPFLLASLIYDQSDCRPYAYKRYRERELYGLSHFPLKMHKNQIKKNIYTYYLKSGDNFYPNKIELKYKFTKSSLQKIEPNIYFTALTLSIFKQQRDLITGIFNEHGAYGKSRHFISNWFYGDYVRSPEPENRVLTARRRLIEYYIKSTKKVAGQIEDVSLYSPLDGTPRLVIDYFGNKRGRVDSYGHNGIDIDGTTGEPVYAIADGRVSFAGMDTPGSLNHKKMTPEEADLLTQNDIPQGGGFYVSINHKSNVGSTYMHLDSFCVRYNQIVKAGEVIGTLGRSGSIKSGPHLHLELRKGEVRVDPAKYLNEILVNPY